MNFVKSLTVTTHGQLNYQRGALAIEYVLILAIFVTIAIVTANAMSHELQAFFEVAAEKITAWLG